MLGRHRWLVTRYDDVLMVLTDERFSKEWSTQMPWFVRRGLSLGFVKPLTRNLTNLDPPPPPTTPGCERWCTRRSPRGSSSASASGFRACVTSCSMPWHPTAKWSSSGRTASLVPLTIIAELLGIPPQDRPKFHSWSSSIVAATSGVRGALRAVPTLWFSNRYLRKLFAQRRA